MRHGLEEVALRGRALPLALKLCRVVPPNGGAKARAGKRDSVNGGISGVRLGSFFGYLVNHFILQDTNVAGGPPETKCWDVGAKGLESTPGSNSKCATPLTPKNSTEGGKGVRTNSNTGWGWAGQSMVAPQP